MKSAHRTGNTVLIGCVAALVLVGVSIALSFTYSIHRELSEARSRVAETYAVKQLISGVVELVVNAEDSVRGFALTSSPVFLEQLEQAESKMHQALADLTAAIRADSVQAARVQRVLDLCHGRLNHAKRMVQLVEADAPRSDISKHAERGMLLTQEIKSLADVTFATEVSRFADRSETLTDAIESSRAITWSLVLSLLVLLLGLVVVLIRARRATALVKICAWSKTIEYQGEWLTFEQYLERRFGLPISHGINPDEAEKFLAASKGPQGR